MIKNNAHYEWFASIEVPNPELVGYWIDLGADSKGRIIKTYNHDINRWVVLFDVSKDDYVPPFIGSNGNWWVDNRDTGVSATSKSPYIGDNDHWFVYDPINKEWVDTGVEAKGLSAYEVAVENGFEGSEQDWLDSLSAASEAAAIVALEAANKANEAATSANDAADRVNDVVEDAVQATEAVKELTSNPPKIIDGNWWFWDIDQDEYVDSGIQAIGDAFTYKKEYSSVEEMEADLGTADVKIGEYVLINTGNVEDPDDAKVYLKTNNGWKFIVDLSGMQGIQGWSAYEVAVKNGFIGTEADWLQSLKQPALDAAEEALAAKDAVEATEAAVKEAEATRVEAEDARVIAENTRVDAENTRISNESIRESNEAIRQQQEADRQSNTATAISNANEATSAAQEATTDAIEATANANTQANRAKEYADNPPEVHDDGYWYTWDETTDQYENTGWQASGLRLLGEYDSLEELQAAVTNPEYGDGYMINGDLYLWDGEQWNKIARIQGPEAELTKAKIESVLVGEVTTHTHDTRYYTKQQTDDKIGIVANDLATNYYNKSQVDSKFTSVYIFKGSVPTETDLPTEGNVVGDVWNIESNDKNVAWTGTGWDALGGTAELASLTANGLMSKEDFAKLSAIEAGAQVNKIESITKRVLLNIVDKNVTIPEDIKISSTEPTEEEIMWLDPSEDYTFDFDAYTKAQADEYFPKKTQLNSVVTGGTVTQDPETATVTLNTKNTINDSTSNVTLNITKATTSTAGIMSSADKVKLDGLSNYDDSEVTSDIAALKTNKLESVESTGTGNVITSITTDGTVIKVTKDITALTQTDANSLYVKKTGDTMLGGLVVKTTTSNVGIRIVGSDTYGYLQFGDTINIDGTHKGVISGISAQPLTSLDIKTSDATSGVTINDNKIWHAGNDGADSGLDADLLDGIQSERIIFGDNAHGTIDIATSDRPDLTINTINKSGFYRDNFTFITNTNGNDVKLQEIIHWQHPTSDTGNEYSLQLLSNYDKDELYFRKRAGGVWSTIRRLADASVLEDSLAYWYENDENNSSTTCNRGGNRNVIESLRSKFKRCIAKSQADGSVVIAYTSETHGALFPDGSSATSGVSDLSQCMVHFPKYYHKTVEVSSGVWRTYISEIQIDNDYIEEPECLIGMYEAYNSGNRLFSVGGVESTASQTISTFFTQAQANGSDWGLINYRAHATIARMFCAYYGTTNISTLNEDIPCSGGTKRYDYGLTNGTMSLGNKDGRNAVNGDSGYYSTSFLGLEDCYYSKWEFVQGLNIIGENYITYDGGCFPGKDVAALEEAGATNIRVIGAKPYSSEAEGTYHNGWIRRVAQGRYGDVMPTEIGGSETTYYADYTWQYKQAATGERIFLRSGGSDNGSRCGVFVANCNRGSFTSNTPLGSRLAFYGKINVVDSDTFKNLTGI